ncbi:MAG TPA: nuclear transport factor 2 family protein [Thermoanaerobaculia bacterium]|nr:nuclear transport factor 2 family protein [Thermoanaerobaculia bacterium]
MKTTAALILFLALLGSAAHAADPAEEVRKSEIAFPKAFADRDYTAFAAFILDDATFLPASRTLSGKKAIMEVWSKYLEPKQPPFSWRPERVAVNGSGTIGLSTGPVFDPDGKQIGVYSSIWLKQSDGTWKIEFDGPGCPPPCPASPAAH